MARVRPAPTVDSAPPLPILPAMLAPAPATAPCPLCHAVHTEPCEDAATDATPLLDAGVRTAGTMRALATAIGLAPTSLSRSRRHALDRAAERGGPPALILAPPVRRNLVRYLRGEPVTPQRLPAGKAPKPTSARASESGKVAINLELPPEIDATVTALAAADPTQPGRATVVRALLIEALAARGYDLGTGAVPAVARPVDADLAERRQTDPRSKVAVLVPVATAIEHAAAHAPAPRGAPPVSPVAMARVLVGEAILARGVDPWTGERVPTAGQ